jgi:hypothetical protein
MHRLLAPAVLLAALALGCESPTAAHRTTAAPHLDFTSGPSSLPNVLRSKEQLFFAWPDFDNDMAILVNPPADPAEPADLRECGGTQLPAELVAVQSVGELRGVIKQVRLARDVRIYVYQPAPPTFPALCAAVPIASGTGNLTSTDNDLLDTGNGVHAIGYRAQGTVELVGGGTARVTAVLQLLIRPDGTLQVVVGKVMLHPTGPS